MIFNSSVIVVNNISSDIGGALDQMDSPFRLADGSFNLQSLITGVIGLILAVIVLVCFFFLLYGAIKWITSSGDKEAATTAQKTITAAIIGLALAFSTWAIMGLLGDFFGIELIDLAVPGQNTSVDTDGDGIPDQYER